VAHDYERNTGRVIVELFRNERLSPDEIPAVLVRQHGPFTWGEDALAAVENARALELVARLEILVRATGARVVPPASFLVDKHFLRKHGKGAYYGQG
jgi:L-ribulose-5-phosphate 4-epimerase